MTDVNDSMKNNEVLSVHVQTKLSEREYAPFKLIIEETGIKKAKLFREIIISNGSNYVVQDKGSDIDKKRVVFLANKASNNINQLAKKINESYRTGIVSETTFLQLMNSLISIEKTFKESIKKC